MQGTTFLSFSSVSFGISFEHAVQLPFTVFLYSPFPDNYAFLSLSPSQIKNIQSADTVPVHGHSPLVCSSGTLPYYTDNSISAHIQDYIFCIFIALIHPIQWTIALPVGATGPAKRQKKTSCIYYRQDRSQSVHSPGGASYFISCLPIDVIACFSFGAKECAEDFLQRYVFEVLQRTLPSFLFFISTEYLYNVTDHYVVSWTETRFLRARYGPFRQPPEMRALS